MFARTRIALAVGPALVMLLSACSSSSAAPAAPQSVVSSAPAASASASAPASASASARGPADAATLAVKMADSSLGSILVDGKGRTLYMYTKDTKSASTCTGACLVNWPALIGKPTMGAGVDDSKLGSFTRTDGTAQASYNGWPLYYWKSDVKAGDVLGQNVGTVWFVLDHDGNPVKK